MNYEVCNNSDHINLTIYTTDALIIIEYNLYKEDIQFFVRLRNNLHDKKYADQKSTEKLSYINEILTLQFGLSYDEGSSLLNIDEKDFIKSMCDAIISQGIKMNIISL